MLGRRRLTPSRHEQPFATTVAGIFCIPATGSDLVNALADLPGPAAISVSGTASIQLF